MKILKRILLPALVALFILEGINFFEFAYASSSWNPEENHYMGGPHYEPLIVSGYYMMFSSQRRLPAPAKPVIYLYPASVQKVSVRLDYDGTITADYPEYNYMEKGWTVTAYPDGKIIGEDGNEYSYLFWEGISARNINFDLSEGFVISGENTREFLQETLPKFGLTPKEYNEFIVYWYPKMKDNKYNLIHFAGSEYTDSAPLSITPKPDSMLRVFMVVKPLDKMMSIRPQKITPFLRTGFSVVEWGGDYLRD